MRASAFLRRLEIVPKGIGSERQPHRGGPAWENTSTALAGSVIDTSAAEARPVPKIAGD